MKTVENWHRAMRSRDSEIWDQLLDEHVVFHSPVVFTPQKGKKITKIYLTTAAQVFETVEYTAYATNDTESESKFRYVNETIGKDSAILEFETELDGTYINGVDLIKWNGRNKLTEVKVLVRPLQAVNVLHQKMQAMLESS